MKKLIAKITAASLLAVMITLSGCATVKPAENDTQLPPVTNIEQELPEQILPPAEPNTTPEQPSVNEEPPAELPPAVEEPPAVTEPPAEVPEEPPVPKPQTVSYISVSTDKVNIRSGAGTEYSVKGQAEKSTLYALNSLQNGWYKTSYKNSTAYISSQYCVAVDMPSSGNAKIEAVISEGTKCLGVPYVYGATRMHDGKGNLIKGFTTSEFDCSSLMQYIFYNGAGVKLNVNTRTQIYQGKTVTKSQLKRGDLMFFTNDSRKNNTGIERVGHVALYLGDNWILHTASDYAKIEQITAKRWSYFIQGQRII